MSDNLKYWNELKQPPTEALSKIKAGRIKGMTDIKPIWRVQAMTEQFGICGVGWKFEVVKKWLENGSLDQIVAFVDVNVFVCIEKKWSEPIPGNGSSKLVTKESSGLYTNDEAFKMATTDALSSALKMLGVAADIYMGSFDGSKYTVPKSYKKTYVTEDHLAEFKKYCVKESLDPKEIAIKYGITTKLSPDQFVNTFAQLKKDVKSGEIGYRFAIPEGEDETFDPEITEEPKSN